MWNKGLHLLNRSVENITAVMLAVMVILIFLQIVSREVVGSSFAWTEEVARFLMIWVTFLGASFAFQHGAHIGIEFFKMKLPVMFRKIFNILAFLSSTVFFMYMIVQGSLLVDRAMTQTSTALNLPMGYAYLVIPISGVLMFINLLDVTIKTLSQGGELNNGDT
ncbi:TRAP transporter small permease [Evansella clarkii]|jgi:TRAP-type C4-dicarboxylate transport system permease small subunit|uniref:TRAP transporter small permease n=1 Tax=Evansella clarkii TaxID=79879 RepID=UPI000996988E|nr:TRAP transporter small permease [Evansella clarkii]